MYGHIQNLEFRMTSSNGVMVGRFLVFPFVKENAGIYCRLFHNVAIEEYYPCIPGTYQRGKDRYVCLAGQSLRQDSEEWIEYIPRTGSTVSVKPGTPSMAVMDSALDFTMLPPLHTNHSAKSL